MSGKRLVAPKAGDPIRESFLRDLVARVERLEAITARGERGFIDNTTGYFPFTKQLPIRQFQLNESLWRGQDAEADMLSWSQEDNQWVEGTGGVKTLYATFMTGYWRSGDMVAAAIMGGRYEVLTPGRKFEIVMLTEDLERFGTASAGSIEVRDSLGLEETMPSGTVVAASWDESSLEWVAHAAPCEFIS